MRFDESMEISTQYLRTALSYMGQYNIPVTPQNYWLWYEYQSGTNQNLKKAIDRLIQESAPITSEMCFDLYSRFVVDERKIIFEALRRKIPQMLAGLQSHNIDMGHGLSRSQETIKGYLEQLLEDIDVDSLRRITHDIIDETRSIEASGELFKQRLNASMQEVSKLRNQLERYRKEAFTDGLTGLANRKGLDDRMEKEIKNAERDEKDLSLVMADIDYFKRINDSYGHLVGDNVLKMVAASIKKLVKGKDFLARYGGEEFLILLPETSLDGAATVAEQIRSYFETAQWKKKDSVESLGSITLSFGVTVYRPGESKDDFIQRADEALYNSKSSGRNRVTERR